MFSDLSEPSTPEKGEKAVQMFLSELKLKVQLSSQENNFTGICLRHPK